MAHLAQRRTLVTLEEMNKYVMPCSIQSPPYINVHALDIRDKTLSQNPNHVYRMRSNMIVRANHDGLLQGVQTVIRQCDILDEHIPLGYLIRLSKYSTEKQWRVSMLATEKDLLKDNESFN